jgi:hypothetical protein
MTADEPDLAPEGADEPREHGRVGTFVVDKGMPFLTAMLTVLAAALGVWGVKATSDKGELADSVTSLENERDVLREDNASLTVHLADMETSRDSWKERAEDAERAGTSGSTTTTLPVDPSDPPDDVAASAAGIFRETGRSPVTFAYSYGIDLDTRDVNWGIASFSQDISLSKHTDGLALFISSGVIAVVDKEASYAECDAQTVLQDDLGAELTVVGSQFCMRTSEGRWAYVKIVGLDTARETITIHIVVFTLQN